MKITPEKITQLADNQVFVFGSNFRGAHGKGAALTAVRKFGAKYGQGTGLMGQSYGIATKDRNIQTLSLREIGIQVDKFVRFAEAHPELEFLVTQVGCGLAGYQPKEIASLFFANKIPDNVSLPECFWKLKPNG